MLDEIFVQGLDNFSWPRWIWRFFSLILRSSSIPSSLCSFLLRLQCWHSLEKLLMKANTVLFFDITTIIGDDHASFGKNPSAIHGFRDARLCHIKIDRLLLNYLLDTKTWVCLWFARRLCDAIFRLRTLILMRRCLRNRQFLPLRRRGAPQITHSLDTLWVRKVLRLYFVLEWGKVTH